MDGTLYGAKLKRLIAVTVPDLQAARSTSLKLRVVLGRFFKNGAAAHFSTGELVDFLGVSSPSILERARFSDDEAEHAMKLAGGLGDQEIEAAEM
jgi:hypothetical protein